MKKKRYLRPHSKKTSEQINSQKKPSKDNTKPQQGVLLKMNVAEGHIPKKTGKQINSQKKPSEDNTKLQQGV